MHEGIKMKHIAAVAIFLSGVAAHAGDWPGWRGPNHDGSTSETSLPTEWSAAQGVLWASNRGVFLARWLLLSSAIGIIAVLVLVPRMGVMGALGAAFILHAVYRLGLQFRARRYRQVPFEDKLALMGGAWVLITLAISHAMDLQIQWALLAFLISSGLLLLVARQTVLDIKFYSADFLRNQISVIAPVDPSVLANDPTESD